MTPLTPQRVCTAMVKSSIGAEWDIVCGEPVAELPNGPCAHVYEDGTVCAHIKPQAQHVSKTFFERHDWVGRLVHVTLGPCDALTRAGNICGRSERSLKHRRDPEMSGAIRWRTADGHAYAPTVTERSSEHDAEVSDAD